MERIWQPILRGDDAARAERTLAGARLCVCAYGLWQVSEDPGLHGLTTMLAIQGVLLAYGACAAFLLFRLPRLRPAALVRAMTASFVSDAFVVLAISLITAEDPTDPAHLSALVLPVLGGFKFGRGGSVTGTMFVVAAQVSRSVIQTGRGVSVDPGDSALLILLAALLGALTAQVARSMADSTATAQANADAFERSTLEYEGLVRVLRAGIEVGGSTVTRRLVDELRGALGPGVHIGAVLLDATSDQVLAITPAGFSETEDRAPVGLIDADGPLLKALKTGQVQNPPTEVVVRLRRLSEDTRSCMVAPMHSRGRVIGCLVAESPAESAFDNAVVDHLGHLAETFAVALEAAQSFQREAEVAERLRELDRMKTHFVAIASHELRTPLTAVLGFAETLKSRHGQLASDQQRQLILSIDRQARRLADLVDDLATVSSLDAGELQITVQDVDLQAAVATAIETTLGNDPTLRDAIIVRGTAPVALRADEGRLVQVLVNLLANGLRHGQPPVVLDWTPSQGGSHAAITISDEGQGIPVDRRTDVFERFVHLHDSDQHQRGSGLGLAISRDLVEAMGGTLELVDGPHTTFELRLPVADAVARIAAHSSH